MKPILEIHNVWKQYQIGGRQEQYLSLREQLINSLRPSARKESFWALQDVAFEAYPGDCIGIVGRNGAGKSTLLKILSKITPPTRGYIKARGRIASLLEVGTGFHPELTGRENIYLNGSILGLRQIEINQKFQDIVDFSGVDQFIDTPLKHYSSGMMLRLAFSVAAHLEPEILLIDEVLAVGDTAFQKKCIGKMEEVRSGGRTILFVSHDLDAIRKLCKRGIILDKGQIVAQGEISDIVTQYLSNFSMSTTEHAKSIVGKRLFGKYTIADFNLSIEARKMHIELTLEGGDFSKITSVIINVFALSGNRISLVDMRENLNPKAAESGKKRMIIQSTTDFEHYIEGIYHFTVGIEHNSCDWFESDRIGIELLGKKGNEDLYAAKYRGYFEVDAQNEISYQ